MGVLMFGWRDQDASQQRTRQLWTDRRDLVTDYWTDQKSQRNQFAQYCMCGARKLRSSAGGDMEFHCPNRHRPDHQPGAAYGRALPVYLRRD